MERSRDTEEDRSGRCNGTDEKYIRFNKRWSVVVLENCAKEKLLVHLESLRAFKFLLTYQNKIKQVIQNA